MFISGADSTVFHKGRPTAIVNSFIFHIFHSFSLFSSGFQFFLELFVTVHATNPMAMKAVFYFSSLTLTNLI